MVHKGYVTLKAMNIMRTILSGFMCLFFLAAVPETGVAHQDQDEALKGRKKGDLIPYGQIARKAERQFGGRVVGQKLRQTGADQWIYELKILKDDGKVLTVVMDAKNGKVLRTSGR